MEQQSYDNDNLKRHLKTLMGVWKIKKYNSTKVR